MEYQQIIYETKDNVAFITLNRPEKLNAWTPRMCEEQADAIDKANQDESVGAIIMTGAGRGFCAGADIKMFLRSDTFTAREIIERLGKALEAFEDLDVPVIAAVNGFALGGGCEISMACHMRVASETATFGQPEVLLGILPGWGGTQRLPRLVGLGIANELITTGRMVSASEAKLIGLVNHVVPPNELMNKCKEIAAQILKNGPNAIAKSLVCIREGIGKSMEEGLKIEVDQFSKLFGTEEANEGLSAFVEKRKPKFRGNA